MFDDTNHLFQLKPLPTKTFTASAAGQTDIMQSQAVVPAGVCHEKQSPFGLFRNCINDGSWSAVYALQQEYTNRPKVLCSKGKVLSVGVKRYREVSGKCNGVECK